MSIFEVRPNAFNPDQTTNLRLGTRTPRPVSSQPSSGFSTNASREDHQHLLATSDVSNWYPTISSSGDPQPIVGGGVSMGNYSVIGNKLFYETNYTLYTSNTVGTGNTRVHLPFPASKLNQTALSKSGIMGSAFLYDYSAAMTYIGVALWGGVGTNFMHIYVHGYAPVVGPTVPFAWVENDQIRIHGWVPLL